MYIYIHIYIFLNSGGGIPRAAGRLSHEGATEKISNK